jgi:hypothetical protein
LDADPDFFYKYSTELTKSFLMEMGLTVFSLSLLMFIQKQQKKINYLADPANQKDIRALREILDHETFKKNNADDSDDEKDNGPLTGAVIFRSKTQQDRDLVSKEEKKIEEERLKKAVVMSFVDCDWYYKFNQLFFVFSLVFILFQGMLNNSCIDIPSLFLILGLAAAYPYRKYYTKTVLEYTFFVIYYV